MKKLELIKYPKKGDIACAKSNFDMGLWLFGRFTKHDEEIALDNNTLYYVIKDNPVPSIKPLFTEKEYNIIKNSIRQCHGDKSDIASILYKVNSANELQNGVETDNEQPILCPKCNEGYMIGYKNDKWCQNHCK